jgi:hypothetical protein
LQNKISFRADIEDKRQPPTLLWLAISGVIYGQG